MAFVYNPADALDDGASKGQPLPAGQYEVLLYDVGEGQSKSSGADMLTLVLDTYKSGKKAARVWDFFVAPHNGKKGTLWKMAQMAEAMGPEFVALLKSGEFQPADYVDCRFLVELEVDGDFNRVKKWVKCLSDAKSLMPTATGAGASSKPDIPESDIPF